MRIGVPREIKRHEYRAGMTPACVRAYVAAGHTVTVQAGTGTAAGFEDEAYVAAGARMCDRTEDIWAQADMIVKVKEPIGAEYGYFRKGLLLFAYLHLAADEALTRALLQSGVAAVAYETIRLEDGTLPCLKPMSEIAGRLSVQEGAKCLETPFGGRGVLLGGVPGVRPGKVAILGGGVVGTNAAKMAAGMGADVTVLDVSARRLEYLDDMFNMRLTTLYSTPDSIAAAIAECDLLIGAVLLPGARAPRLVRRAQLALMKPGAVIVDVAVDQGGCVETTHATTHDQPTYVVDGIVHYAVANMPAAVARTSTLALTSATLQYGLMLAGKGVTDAAKDCPAIAAGVNCLDGQCCCEGVARAFRLSAAHQ
ncbi:MAG: alanine dehydrogenase [Kiritimatiellae bacterium]|nr:alanine dehydrogenase [Kiritimatiellia bacterium]